MNLYEDLMYRGLIKDFSDPELKDKLNNEKLTFYIGTDPTADSLIVKIEIANDGTAITTSWA